MQQHDVRPLAIELRTDAPDDFTFDKIVSQRFALELNPIGKERIAVDQAEIAVANGRSESLKSGMVFLAVYTLIVDL